LRMRHILRIPCMLLPFQSPFMYIFNG
jgi:hypothetical protein